MAKHLADVLKNDLGVTQGYQQRPETRDARRGGNRNQR